MLLILSANVFFLMIGRTVILFVSFLDLGEESMVDAEDLVRIEYLDPQDSLLPREECLTPAPREEDLPLPPWFEEPLSCSLFMVHVRFKYF